MNVEAGSKIGLLHHLGSIGSDTFYVQAEVLRPDRSHITGSPIQLTDEGDGRFFNDTLTMPNEDFVTVTYKVFKDAGLTEEALDDYDQRSCVIGKESGGSGDPIVISVRDRIIAKTRQSRSKVQIKDSKALRVEVSDPELTAQLQDDNARIEKQTDSKKVRTQ